MLVWLVAVWTSVAVAADCPAPTSQIDISTMLARAEVSYRDLDSDGFHSHLDSAMLDLPCLADVLTTDTAATIHRVQAVAMYGRGNSGATITAFASANAVDPEGGLPDDLVPDGHELQVLSRSLLNSDTTRLDLPAARTRIVIDGETTRVWPTERPVIAQIVSAEYNAPCCSELPGSPLPHPPCCTASPETRARSFAMVMFLKTGREKTYRAAKRAPTHSPARRLWAQCSLAVCSR